MISWFSLLKSRIENGSDFLQTREGSYDFSELFSELRLGLLQTTARLWRTNGLFVQFCRTFSKSRGKKNKLRGKKLGQYRIKSRRIPNYSSQKCVSEKNRPIFPEKHSIICDFQARWESHNSQQLFLSSKSRVKWRGRICVFFLNPNRSLDCYINDSCSFLCDFSKHETILAGSGIVTRKSLAGLVETALRQWRHLPTNEG